MMTKDELKYRKWREDSESDFKISIKEHLTHFWPEKLSKIGIFCQNREISQGWTVFRPKKWVNAIRFELCGQIRNLLVIYDILDPRFSLFSNFDFLTS